MKILDGKKISAQILDEIRARVASLALPPRLVIVQVGENAASGVYIRNKVKACAQTGIPCEHVQLPADVDQGVLNARLEEISSSPASGIILQLPLPAHLDADLAMEHLDPRKDVDGFHPDNLGRLVAGRPYLVPCTPAGIRELLAREAIDTRGRHVVVLGRSLIVGKPAALLFLEKSALGDATVTVCHSASRDLAEHCRRADILIAAVGRAGLVTAGMVKEGVVVVDVGMNRVLDPAAKSGARWAGDCDFAGIAPKAAAITPVPGGVGPMTVAMLLANTLRAHATLSGREA